MYFISMMILLFICHLWLWLLQFERLSSSKKKSCCPFSLLSPMTNINNKTTTEIVFWCVLNWKKLIHNINWIYVYCLSLFSSFILRIFFVSSSPRQQTPGLVFSPTTYFVGPHSQHRVGHHVLQDAYIANICRDVFLIVVVSILTE